MNNKIVTKDLINIGIFTAIYFILFFGVGMVGFIPIFMVLLPFLCSLVTGIPFMLFLTKVNKFGMITIMGTLLGGAMIITGHHWIVIFLGFICGFLADIIMKSGDYREWKKILIGFCVFSQWLIGGMIPMFVMRDSFFENLRKSYGDSYTNTLLELTPNWMFIVLIILGIIGSILGAYIGKNSLKKHFKRAGIA